MRTAIHVTAAAAVAVAAVATAATPAFASASSPAGRLEHEDLTPQMQDEFTDLYRRWRSEQQ